MAPSTTTAASAAFPKAQEAGSGNSSAAAAREDTPLVRTTQPQQQPTQSVAVPALLPGADPEMAAAFEEGALCMCLMLWWDGPCIFDPDFPRPITHTHHHTPVTASRPRRVVLTSLLALGLLVLAGLFLARVDETPQQQGLDGACVDD
jgi:hypothetical protein